MAEDKSNQDKAESKPGKALLELIDGFGELCPSITGAPGETSCFPARSYMNKALTLVGKLCKNTADVNYGDYAAVKQYLEIILRGCGDKQCGCIVDYHKLLNYLEPKREELLK